MAIAVSRLNYKNLHVGDKVRLNLGITQEYVRTKDGIVLKKKAILATATVVELAQRWFRAVVEYKNGNSYSICINYISGDYERV